MLALPPSVDNAQQPDGVRALKDLTDHVDDMRSPWDSDFDGNDLDGLRKTVDELQSIVRDLVRLLQSANAGTSQPVKTAEESANGKEEEE